MFLAPLESSQALKGLQRRVAEDGTGIRGEWIGDTGWHVHYLFTVCLGYSWSFDVGWATESVAAQDFQISCSPEEQLRFQETSRTSFSKTSNERFPFSLAFEFFAVFRASPYEEVHSEDLQKCPGPFEVNAAAAAAQLTFSRPLCEVKKLSSLWGRTFCLKKSENNWKPFWREKGSLIKSSGKLRSSFKMSSRRWMSFSVFSLNMVLV